MLLSCTVLFVGTVQGQRLASSVSPRGTVEMNGVKVPDSTALSPEAREYIRTFVVDALFGTPEQDIEAERLRQHAPYSESNGGLKSVFSYLASVAVTDPLAYPLNSRELLAEFPPTPFTTARAFELSAALGSHNALAKAGGESEFYAWDGLNHGFFYNANLPESRDAYDIMVRFYVDHLEESEARER